jgi:ABC-type transport system involved in multi-copper enzyme maturation permease subunit
VSGVVIIETMRRHMTNVAYILFLLFVAAIGMFASMFNTPGAMWPSLIGMLAIITGSAIIGPELSSGSLQLIVSKPIRRSIYLVSRVTGVLCSVVLVAVVGLMGETILRLLRNASGVSWERLASAFFGTVAASLLTIALLALLGSLTRSYFNVALYLGAQIAVSASQGILGLVRTSGHPIGDFLAENPAIEQGLAAAENLLFPAIPPMLNQGWVLRVLATAAVVIVLACLVFQRREVPYGAD